MRVLLCTMKAKTPFHQTMEAGGITGIFKAKYWANLLSDSPWSIGDGLIPTEYHYPLNRHYIAGYFFTDWLQETYGEEIFKKVLSVTIINFL